MTTQKRVYGWRPDKPDFRNVKFSKISRPITTLPTSVDLRSTCSPVEDQGDFGSCTADALVGALEFIEMKDKVATFQESQQIVCLLQRTGSRTLYKFGCRRRDQRWNKES